MRILYIANGYPPAENGGVETYTYQLVKNLFARGHEIQVFCRHVSPERPDFEILHEIVEDIPVIRLVNDFKCIDNLEHTYRETHVEDLFEAILDKTPFDLIHFNHLIGLSSRLPLISNSRQIPSIFTLHDFWPFCARINLVDWRELVCPGLMQGADCLTCMSGGQSGWYLRMLRSIKQFIPFKLRQLVRRNILMQGSRGHIMQMQAADFFARYESYHKALLSVDRLLAPSEYLRRLYIANGYPENGIEVLPLGVVKPVSAVETHQINTGHALTFGFVGSLIPVKGLDLLLRAFRRLPSQELRLLIFGSRELAPPDYRRLLDNLANSDPRIRFMGPFSQSERTAVYRQLDVVVVPSRMPKSFSLVAREALIHSRPVIAARIGALPEIIKPGVNGDLFASDDEMDLLRCLEAVIQDTSYVALRNQFLPDEISDLVHHADMMERIYRETAADRLK